MAVIANFKMTVLDKFYGRQEFDLAIKVPTSIEIVHMDDKVRFRGKKDDISKFAPYASINVWSYLMVM